MKVPIQGHSGLVRDTRSGAVINMSTGGQEYSQNKARMAAETERLNKVEQDVSEIKDMLKQLIER
mgnify:CR=1 FL=1|jgi:hypothetical protein|tara:strand:- start:295 stop:489 length:195 start_codon:yes stop_codon:yes gene_type:complete